MSSVRAVVFDLGGVFIDWNPRYLFRKIAPQESERIEYFLTQVCDQHWNEKQDEGRTFAEALAERRASHPEFLEWIDAYWNRWPETLGDAFPIMVEALERLKAQRFPVYALTNWSAETFPFGLAKFPFLHTFDGIVVSGELKLKKPDPRIFHHLCREFQLRPEHSVFIDDVQKNVDSARALGFHAIHHQTEDPARTLDALRALSVPV